MKKLILCLAMAIISLAAAGPEMANANQDVPVLVRESPAIRATAPEVQGVVKAIEYYINAGRKGDSKVASQGFAPAATMSWSENGKLKSVPIQELFKYFDEKPRSASCELTSLDIVGDVATARIESVFDDARFTDMFTLVKDGDDWKIISKVYHVKK